MTRSGSKVHQFVHVPTSVDTQNFIQIHPRVFDNLADRQTDKQKNATFAFTSSFVGGTVTNWLFFRWYATY